MNKILGLHHITAIASDAKRNRQFYTNVLGLRLVKKTVNFDDPGTYHLYYGDEIGNAGTILTFSHGKELAREERVQEWQLIFAIQCQKIVLNFGKIVSSSSM